MYARGGKRNISKRYDYIEFESEYPLWRGKDDSKYIGSGTYNLRVGTHFGGKRTTAIYREWYIENSKWPLSS